MTHTLSTSHKKTPMMQQWHACKTQAKDALLLFRMGDFYEAFYDDAITLAKELDLTLTKRQEIPMSGVPWHQGDTYIDRLVAKGYRVAIAEQVEDPKQAKGLVKREIVRVVSPGAVIQSSLLAEKTNNFFASFTQLGSIFGLAFLDLSTGEFKTIEFENLNALKNELFRLKPSECLVPLALYEKEKEFFTELKVTLNIRVNTCEKWHFDHEIAYETLTSHFHVRTLDGFGLKGLVAGINAAGALVNFLKDELFLDLAHIKNLSPYSVSEFMLLDPMTLRNLELTENQKDGSKKNTLLSLLDNTQTPMGGRLFYRWVKQPLLCYKKINERLDAVQKLRHIDLDPFLSKIKDIERIITKITSGYATAKDIVALRFSFEPIPELKKVLSSTNSSLIKNACQNIPNLSEIINIIKEAIVENPPLRLSDGYIFKEGFCQELDELRAISTNSKKWLSDYQVKLKETYQIKNLKVGYNKMFGYYIEISKGQAHLAPKHFQRRQTLVNAERFITDELKEFEVKVLSSQEKISKLETALFNEIKEKIASFSTIIHQTAKAIAIIDALYSLAKVANKPNYTCPKVNDSNTIMITKGRHPVIESTCLSERFIPNDTTLNQNERLLLITGPNMAGKSTYIRQVALIVIMAQIGSFVPCESATIGCVDKVFTRIGANDDLTKGQSTFMVEMVETATILNNATKKSLVILDEIGRGTSTYDGISIARAVAEHLLNQIEAKTLFATHYFELTDLEKEFSGAVNYNIAVQEVNGSIHFLRKIVKGCADKSYGIHVASLAGLPLSVVERSQKILTLLERKKHAKTNKKEKVSKSTQLSFIVPKKDSEYDAILNELSLININHMTPFEAMQKIMEWSKRAKQK